MITFTSLAPNQEIGASSFLLELGPRRILLDAGTHPKREGKATLPCLNHLPYDSLDAIFLSHAHLDHSGATPVVMREHPRARIFSSEPTRLLANALLHNSVNVMTSKRLELGLPEFPLFTHKELEGQFPRWETAPWETPFQFHDDEEVAVTFHESGHILGAVSPEFEYGGRKILYTGDIHFEDQTLTRAARLPKQHFDTVIVETTRGAAPRCADYTRENEIAKLAEAIRDTIERRGVVLLPVFAMGKSQELLTILHDLKLRKEIPDAPVHLGGLSTKMTTIYDSLASASPRLRPGFQILREVDLNISPKKKKRREIPFIPGHIYALSSGMMTEKTVSNEFAHRVIRDRRSAILFIGYADPDSPAGRILRTEPGGEIQLNPEVNPQPLECYVKKLDFSGHATRQSIRDYVVATQPRNLILVHGDKEAVLWFKDEFQRLLPQTTIHIPEPKKPIEL